jgi:hypothetical protein
MDRDSRKRRLDRLSRNERIFPGGEDETRHCTACARIIADRFGGKVRPPARQEPGRCGPRQHLALAEQEDLRLART